MSKEISVYSKQTGAILRALDVPETYTPVDDDETGYLDGKHSDVTHYVPGGVLQERPKMSLSISGASVSEIPAEAVVQINGSDLPVSVTEFSLAQSGIAVGSTVQVRVRLWPYQTENFELSTPEEENQ